jgi:hypothetical protein
VGIVSYLTYWEYEILDDSISVLLQVLVLKMMMKMMDNDDDDDKYSLSAVSWWLLTAHVSTRNIVADVPCCSRERLRRLKQLTCLAKYRLIN